MSDTDERLVPGWPDESAVRLEKADALRERGVDPYPSCFDRSHRLAEVAAAYAEKSIEDLEALAVPVRVAGRIITKRGHGKTTFVTLSEGEARLQIYLRRDVIGDEAYEIFGLLDMGDTVGIAGTVMRTRKGELSVQAKEIFVLSKALLPPPEKWSGLQDVELRYRQRYVDLQANPEVRETFVRRSRMIARVRHFLDERGYIEVETPMMQPVAGGAVARPFVTHHNALGIDLFLRIAPELYLKRLVVGGLERVYEINRNFRNEGISVQHNPEFTMLEFYTAYFDYRDVMETTEQLIADAARVADGPMEYQKRPISFEPPFKRVPMKEAILEAARRHSLDLSQATLDESEALAAWCAQEHRGDGEVELGGPEFAALNHGKRLMRLFEQLVEPTLWEPTFITDHPVEVSPLSKRRKDDPSLTERFELFGAGMELANGFSELNDPLEQRDRFLDQLGEREKGDDEAHRMDDDYVRALGHGLPPTGGCGVGIDRLAMIFTDSASIRDVILFPQLRPAEGRSKPDQNEE